MANTGFFGMRLMQLAEAHRLEVVEVPVEVGAPIDPQAIADVADSVTHPVETAQSMARQVLVTDRVLALTTLSPAPTASSPSS